MISGVTISTLHTARCAAESLEKVQHHLMHFLSGQNTIEGNYLDGVSVTHEASGSRTHIWSFGAALQKMNGCFNPFFCYLSFMPLCLLGTFTSLHSLMYQKVHGH